MKAYHNQITLTLKGGQRATVTMQITADPVFPTPGEPDVRRGPHVTEWLEICELLATLDHLEIQRIPE